MTRPSPEDIRRRIRAARLLAGMARAEDLADAIDRRGFGKDTIYDMESGERTVLDHELDVIAAATGVSPAFFQVDFTTLAQTGTSLEERVANLERLVAEITGEDVESAIAGFEEDFAEGARSADAKRGAAAPSTERRRGDRRRRA